MKKSFYTYLMSLMAIFTISSCGEDEQLVNTLQNAPLKFEIGAYPAYDNASRTIGTPDAGKTDWADGDIVLVKVTNGGESKTLTLAYSNSAWTPSEEITVSGTPTVEVLYAPGCEWGTAGDLQLKSDDSPYGTFEYVVGDCKLSGNTVSVDFFGKRTYSRLRIVPGITNGSVNVTTTGFTPAGPTTATTPTDGYDLTPDSKGNAYLYGSFSSNATVKVKKGDTVFKDYTFSSATTVGKSYALDAVLIPYLTFSAKDPQTLTMTKAVSTLEYSVGGGNWETLGTTTVTFGGDNGDLQLRGHSATGTASADDPWGDYAKIDFGVADVDVACTGDIRTLVDYKNYTIASTSNARFSWLFRYCTQLISAPELPAMDLADCCYLGMFQGCTGLTEAPALPATTLAELCYGDMFQCCSELTSAPILPATTLADKCYFEMFSACSSLKSAPTLPATTLAVDCYRSMFYGCTSLGNAPALPATTLAKSCYAGMFNECTSLSTAPTLPATTMAEACYNSMFANCTGLTTAPALPATTLAKDCYMGMFSSCTSLSTAPTLPATTLTEGCYSSMFQYCTSLETVPTLPATTLAKSCYAGMFDGCTRLSTTPALPATTLAENCYAVMFQGCIGLTSASSLPATTLAVECYRSMFSQCTSLKEAPALPATTLETQCYQGMFEYCSGLIDPPVLAAETLVTECYQWMFGGCTKLNKVIMLATAIDGDRCLNGWLNDTANEGTFVKAASMDELTLYNYYNNYNPKGWTVENYGEDEQDGLFSWFNPNRYITYVGNYETVYSGDNMYNYCSSIDNPIDKISKIEFKYEMEESSKAIYLCCTNYAKDDYSSLILNQTGLMFNKDDYDSDDNDKYEDYSYTWSELNVTKTDCMTLITSFKDEYIKLNGVELDYKMHGYTSFEAYQLFSYYFTEYDEGRYTEYEGVPEGSKLYYVKIWDENDNLVYLGAASKAVNPKTDVEEYCWRSYYNGEDHYEFAYYPKNKTYNPYGGGID